MHRRVVRLRVGPAQLCDGLGEIAQVEDHRPAQPRSLVDSHQARERREINRELLPRVGQRAVGKRGERERIDAVRLHVAHLALDGGVCGATPPRAIGVEAPCARGRPLQPKREHLHQQLQLRRLGILRLIGDQPAVVARGGAGRNVKGEPVLRDATGRDRRRGDRLQQLRDQAIGGTLILGALRPEASQAHLDAGGIDDSASANAREEPYLHVRLLEGLESVDAEGRRLILSGRRPDIQRAPDILLGRFVVVGEGLVVDP